MIDADILFIAIKIVTSIIVEDQVLDSDGAALGRSPDIGAADVDMDISILITIIYLLEDYTTNLVDFQLILMLCSIFFM